MFPIEEFRSGSVSFKVEAQPVSQQGKGAAKKDLKKIIQEKTVGSDFIVTGHCSISIDYFCKQIKRYKNPSAYDIDNIVKPILDSLVGSNGLLIDDSLANRVTVNWMDTSGEDYISIEIGDPDLRFIKKSELVFVKSDNGWCWPANRDMVNDPEFGALALLYFRAWSKIDSEKDFNEWIWCLPIQPFIYQNKLNSENYEFVKLDDVTNTESE